MTFTDNDLARLKDLFKATGGEDNGMLPVLIARLEGDESLLDRALERLKLINGPEEKCIYADTDVTQCVNHQLIREIESWQRSTRKDGSK